MASIPSLPCVVAPAAERTTLQWGVKGWRVQGMQGGGAVGARAVRAEGCLTGRILAPLLGGLTSRVLAERSEECANTEGQPGTHMPALPSLGPACCGLGAEPFRPAGWGVSIACWAEGVNGLVNLTTDDTGLERRQGQGVGGGSSTSQ